MTRILYQIKQGKIKILIVDFWRDQHEKGIDVEVYVDGVFRYSPSTIFGPSTGDYKKQDAIAHAREHTEKVLQGRIRLTKEK